MNTSQDWRSAALALSQEIAAANESCASGQMASSDRNKAIAERVAALRAENARRTAAGVRVNINAGSFDARHIKLSQDAIDSRDANANEVARASLATTSILSRALRLIQQMGEALNEAEAAEAARDEADAERERQAAAAPGAAQAAAAAAAKRAEEDASRRYWAEPANAAYLVFANDLWERAHSPDPAVRAAARAEGSAAHAPA